MDLLFAAKPNPLLAVAGLLVDDVPSVKGMVVAQPEQGMLERLCSCARHADAEHLHGLGSLARRRVGHGVDIVLEEPPDPAIKRRHGGRDWV